MDKHSNSNQNQLLYGAIPCAIIAVRFIGDLNAKIDVIILYTLPSK